MKSRPRGLTAWRFVALALLLPSTALASPAPADLLACWAEDTGAPSCEAPLRAFVARPAEQRAATIAALAASDQESERALAAFLAVRARTPLPEGTNIEALLRSKERRHVAVGIEYVDRFHAAVHAAVVVEVASRNANPDIRAAALRVLPRLKAPGAVEAARQGLKASSTLVQASAIKVLGQLKDSESADPIAAVLADPRAPVNVRVEAARALALVGDASLTPLLYLASAWPNVALQRAVVSALGRVTPPELAILLGDFLTLDGSRREALIAVGNAHSPALTPKLVGLLALHDVRDQDLRLVFWALGQSTDPGAAPPLIEQLASGDPARAALAAEALGNLRAKTAVRPLVAQLGHADTGVSDMALWALTQITDQRFEKDQARWESWLEENPY